VIVRYIEYMINILGPVQVSSDPVYSVLLYKFVISSVISIKKRMPKSLWHGAWLYLEIAWFFQISFADQTNQVFQFKVSLTAIYGLNIFVVFIGMCLSICICICICLYAMPAFFLRTEVEYIGKFFFSFRSFGSNGAILTPSLSFLLGLSALILNCMVACCSSWVYYFKKFLGSSWQRHTNYWHHRKVLIFFYYLHY